MSAILDSIFNGRRCTVCHQKVPNETETSVFRCRWCKGAVHTHKNRHLRECVNKGTTVNAFVCLDCLESDA